MKNNESNIDISPDEFKMPEEQFGVSQKTSAHKPFVPIIIGILILVLAILLIGLYLWYTTMQNTSEPPTQAQRPTDAQNKEPESTNAKADTQSMQTLSTSDTINAIEADIDNTNLDNIDTDLNAIDSTIDESATATAQTQ